MGRSRTREGGVWPRCKWAPLADSESKSASLRAGWPKFSINRYYQRPGTENIKGGKGTPPNHTFRISKYATMCRPISESGLQGARGNAHMEISTIDSGNEWFHRRLLYSGAVDLSEEEKQCYVEAVCTVLKTSEPISLRRLMRMP